MNEMTMCRLLYTLSSNAIMMNYAALDRNYVIVALLHFHPSQPLLQTKDRDFKLCTYLASASMPMSDILFVCRGAGQCSEADVWLPAGARSKVTSFSLPRSASPSCLPQPVYLGNQFDQGQRQPAILPGRPAALSRQPLQHPILVSLDLGNCGGQNSALQKRTLRL